ARIGERRMLELINDIGADAIDEYAAEWFDFSEQRMIEAIRQLPATTETAVSIHDPYARLPDGVPVKVTVDVDPETARVTVDLRDNPDCLPVGINLSEACARTAAMIGVFNSISRMPGIDVEVPVNPGSIRRIDVLVRENCCVGIPRHPASVSAATTNLQDRVANPVMRCFAAMMDGVGMAEFGAPCPPAGSVISGTDPRTGRPFINQLQLAVTGGPAGPGADGWLTAYSVGASGMMYKDSVEIDEVKHPIRVLEQRLLADSGGPGQRRGAPAALVRIQAVDSPVEFMTNSDGARNPAKGARGGQDGTPSDQWIETATGGIREIESFHREVLAPGEVMVSVSCSGGGYGPPVERAHAEVLADVIEGWVTIEQAARVYGVVIVDGKVDPAATEHARSRLRLHAALAR
ncbi:MAG: hydantoinase B/oxoprolinase family protein, partial [Patulibacter sp.]